MHWVDRGAEPGNLPAIRANYTQRWVDFYQNRIGRKPSDAKWTEFRDELKQPFLNKCGYCEQEDRGQTDHFRPTSLFPHLVYEWTNWIWACHDCNHAKWNKWPASGYINPCGGVPAEGPEKYFEFDLQTGEMLPKNGLTPIETAKAWELIDDLKLNGDHHLNNRRDRVFLLSEILNGFSIPPNATQRAIISRLRSREANLSSLSRQAILGLGF